MALRLHWFFTAQVARDFVMSYKLIITCDEPPRSRLWRKRAAPRHNHALLQETLLQTMHVTKLVWDDFGYMSYKRL